MILHLGVIDVPYSVRATRKRSRSAAGTKTTGDIAEILEAKYGIMQAFFDSKSQEIADDLADSVQGAIESLIMGGPPQLAPFGTGTSKIEDAFKMFISTQEVERVGIPGVPTQAALRGVNHRLKRPYRKSNPRRPSFVDTGLFVASFKSWIDNG